MHHPIASRRAALLAATAALAVSALLACLGALAAPARADGPGTGSPWTVSVGDSYISGEAGRWAGSTNNSSSAVDALGSSAYNDNAAGTGELIPKCHRSKAAEVYIGAGVNGANLACSGAKTSTFNEGETFKPGLDFYSSGGREGQALMLQHFAAAHNVKLVAISIGGNNFNFASIVQTCVEDWLLSPSWWPNYCDDDSSVTSNFTASNVAKVKGEVTTAIRNVAQAMTNAGYSATQYSIVVQDYPSPIPLGSGFRYSQSGFTRQSTGGCGFWNNDANYANEKMLPTINSTVLGAASGAGLSNVKSMDLGSAFNGRRLCEKGVGLLEEQGLASWRSAGAVDRSEWINEIRTVSTIFGPYEVQESIHPNYWGELALRNCLTQAYNGGSPRGGTCTISASGVNSAGEPNMSLH
ncbi:MAG: hypothetical protein JWM60_2284 [Solirubrobacterales bacterium]|jgi:hypothetical protein|nr:hypothetical protein [Solirubrobacterales bacterium]